MAGKTKRANNYGLIVEKIFFNRYQPGINEFEFNRGEIPKAAADLGLTAPRTLVMSSTLSGIGDLCRTQFSKPSPCSRMDR